MIEDYGIYNNYKILKRRQEVIDKSIKEEQKALEAPTQNMGQQDFQKLADLKKQLQIKLNK